MKKEIPSMLRRSFLAAAAGLVAFILAGAGHARANPDIEAAKAFVLTAIDESVRILSDPTGTRMEKVERLRTVIHRFGYVAAIQRAILGEFWKKATPEQQAEFGRLFEDFIVYAYGGPVSEIKANPEVAIVEVRPLERGFVVRTSANQPGEKPTKVDWTVVKTTDGNYRVFDAVLGGISIIQTLRSDFTSVLRNNGGSFDALFTVMREKIAVHKAKII
jgi:phospholipid transport system substrate-binding protein